MKISTYGAIPPDYLSPKRQGPLRHIRAWDYLDKQALAEIPPLRYTSLMLSPWPQLTYQPREVFKL